MFSAMWFAVLGQPVFLLPFPEAPATPAVVAIASSRVSLRRPCHSLACLRAGWTPLPAEPLLAGRNPFVPRRPLPPSRGHGLRAPASRIEWTATHGSNSRVGARYGMEIRDPDTAVRVEIGSGYRLQPYVDDGVGETGPVARGRVEWQQRLGAFALLHQELRFEAGRNDTYVRNALALDVELQPNWTLRSRFELRHHEATGSTATESLLQLRYTF
ncbi:DUF481 domain-containing protein [Cognatiluteimonas lumbrici]|uniref:DUF481 domain-containing protein n=1 Tax=Cognatiluteimonas lumbrici TaxID=2559601 RepID=UPI0015E3C795|nr:DUF481 domain-containing protein [Luteimonas lumbrici]